MSFWDVDDLDICQQLVLSTQYINVQNTIRAVPATNAARACRAIAEYYHVSIVVLDVVATRYVEKTVEHVMTCIRAAHMEVFQPTVWRDVW